MTTGPFAVRSASLTGLPSVPGSAQSGAFWPTSSAAAGAAPGGPSPPPAGLRVPPGPTTGHAPSSLGGGPDPAGVLLEDPPATRVIKAVLRARQTVEAGVTTVRDLGGVDEIALALRDA